MVRPHFRQLWIPFLLAMTLLVAACQSGAPAATAPEEKEPAAAAAVTEKSATETEAEVAAQADPDAAPTGADTLRFTIVPDGTEARFYIDEVLMGNDVTVVGVTSLVDGELTVDPTQPAGAAIGPIRIDARDLTTDQERRNGAIRRFILQSNDDAYQYITFTPTSIDGMPDAVEIGTPFDFTVTGDLQIRDVVHAETFAVTVTAVSATELTGLARTTVLRQNYNLTIPNVPSVANVAEEVPLELEFRAVAGE